MRTLTLFLLLGCQANVSLGGPDPVDAGGNAVCSSTPSVVASGLGTVSAIAVSGGYLYVASQSASDIVRVPVTGGVPTQVASVPSPVAIAVAADQLLIGGGVPGSPGTGSLVSAPLSGGATTTLLIGLDFPSSVAAADGIAFANDTGGANVKLIRVPLAGSSVDAGAPTSPTPTPSGTGIAVAGSFVFVGDGTGGLQRFPELGPLPNSITGGSAKTLQVAASGSVVAWVTADGLVLTTDPTGATVTTVASAQKGPVAVATDGAEVFWSTRGTTGQNDATLARKSGAMQTGAYGTFGAIALDAPCIYWADGAGDVLRMSR